MAAGIYFNSADIRNRSMTSPRRVNKIVEALIVDDETFARDDLRYLLRAHPEIVIIGEAATVGEAKNLLSRLSPQLIFLDVQLMGGTGFDLVPLVPPSCEIIFFTSHNEFAVRAFEINALDYLLKPVSARRLAESLRRVGSQKGLRQPDPKAAQPVKTDDHIFIRTDRERRFVPVKAISAVTAQGGNYTAVCLYDGNRHLVRRTLAEWEKLLPHPPFLRIHRSHMVNIQRIDCLRRKKSGSLRLILKDRSEPLAVSREAVQRLKRSMKALGA
jgi:two-component system LytT family response regulator